MAATINLKVKSDFAAASADLKKFGAVSEATQKKLDKFVNSFKEKETDNFRVRLSRTTAAVKATRGPLEAAQTEHRMLRREIERLIKGGVDPLDDSIKDLTSRYKQLDKEMDDVNANTKNTAKSFSKMDGVMLAAGAAAVQLGRQAVTAMIDFSRESLQAASDAEEIAGKFGVVFGDIEASATAAASTIAKDFDLAASTVNKLLGDTGDILTGLGFDQKTALEMSESVGTLALDLASFTNFAGGAEGASAALTKALLGEAESAKALGIVIRQDTVEYKDLIKRIMETEQVGLVQAKALAALQIATDQSKNAIGDYARTQESSANVTRRLNETIKESKELYGELANKGLTPIKAAIADEIALINQSIKAYFLKNKVLAGEATLIEALISKENELAAAEKELNQSTSAYSNIISGTNKDLEILGRFSGELTNELNAQLPILEKQIEEQKKAVESITRQTTAIEKQIQAEQHDLDLKLSLTQATKDKEEAATTAAEEEKIRIEEEAILRAEKAAERFLLEDEIAQAVIDRDQRIADSAEETAAKAEKAQKDASDAAAKKILEDNKAIRDSYIDIAKGGLGALAQGFKEVGKEIIEGGLTWKTFAKLGLNALSSVLDGLGAQMAAQAAIAFFGFPPRPAAGFGLIAGSAAAFTASGVVSAAAGSFQTGTGIVPFTVPENRSSSRADSQSVNVSPGEQVSVSPRGESGTAQNISVSIDKQVIFDFVNEGIETGDINITTENIQSGVGATA